MKIIIVGQLILILSKRIKKKFNFLKVYIKNVKKTSIPY